MLRYISAAMIFAVCALFGMSKAWDIKSRLGFLQNMKYDIEQIKNQIEFTLRPIKSLISDYSNFKDAEIWRLLCDNMDGSSAAGDAWRMVESSRQEFMRLSAEERRILADFAKGLGTSDLSGQLRQAELAILQLTGAIDALSKELSVKERLYSSLGALTGLAAAILIL